MKIITITLSLILSLSMLASCSVVESPSSSPAVSDSPGYTGSLAPYASMTPSVSPALSVSIAPTGSAVKKTLVDFTGKDVKILIVGNSFISSSNVKKYIDLLAAEKGQKLSVTVASSSGIESFYTNIGNNPKVAEGYYDVILLSGLYAYNDYLAVENVIKVIQGTKTMLTLFPVDTENANFIIGSRILYKSVYIADWNQTLEDLKKNGFTEKNLNNDDWVKHSNDLGGYVGACVAYSFLYGAMPDSKTTANNMITNFGSLIPGESTAQKTDSLKKIEQTAFDLVLAQ